MGKRFTALAIDALKPKDKRYEVGDAEPNLWIVVQPGGAKSFVARYKWQGKSKKLTLGLTTALSLAQAREKVREAMKKVALGADPAAEKQTEKIERLKQKETGQHDLITNVFDAFNSRHLSQRKAGHEVKRIFDHDVLPVWGERKISEITRGDVIVLLDHIVARGSPTMANRTLAHVRKFFNWARSRDYNGLDLNPCDGVIAPVKEIRRDRILSDAELRLLLLASNRLGTPWREIFQLLVFTGVRRNEAISASWQEFNCLDTDKPEWLIPPARTKNGRPHLLPVSKATAELIRSVPRLAGCDYLFSTTRKTPVSGLSKIKSRLDGFMLEIMREQNRGSSGSSVIEPWRIHDIRRTVATGMAGLGISPHIVEAVLNHVSGAMVGVAGIYNRHGYYEEKKKAMKIWADHIDRLRDE